MAGRKSKSGFSAKKLDKAVSEKILCMIAEGWPMTKICRQEGMPPYVTVLRWLSNGDFPEFEKAYQHAREHQADTLTDEIMEDAARAEDTLRGDRSDNARVQAVRLRIDTKKWVASKMKPHKYGDRLGVTGADGGPLEITITNYATNGNKKDSNSV